MVCYIDYFYGDQNKKKIFNSNYQVIDCFLLFKCFPRDRFSINVTITWPSTSTNIYAKFFYMKQTDKLSNITVYNVYINIE